MEVHPCQKIFFFFPPLSLASVRPRSVPLSLGIGGRGRQTVPRGGGGGGEGRSVGRIRRRLSTCNWEVREEGHTHTHTVWLSRSIAVTREGRRDVLAPIFNCPFPHLSLSLSLSPPSWETWKGDHEGGFAVCSICWPYFPSAPSDARLGMLEGSLKKK